MAATPDIEAADRPSSRPSLVARLWRSLTLRLVALVFVFGAVPVALYDQFRLADAEKQKLLLDTVRDKGLLISRAMEPILARADSIPYFRLGEELARYASGPVSLKLLLRPAQSAEPVGFFYIASYPPVPNEALDYERQRLIDDGILVRIGQSCVGDVPLSLRLTLPDGREELVTSITPVKTAGGCWALVVANRIEQLSGRSLGDPYWRSPEVRVAAAIYLALAVIAIGLFFGLYRSVQRFGRMARAIRTRGDDVRFAERNVIPELDTIAEEFDRMVDTLSASAANIRRAAEDTAHAFKTPLGVIRQSLEPLTKRIAGEDRRGQQALAAVEAALDKLDGLVATARQLDEATADVLDPPREAVDLSALCRSLVDSYATAALARETPRVSGDIAPGIWVTGGDDMIETVIENVVDNAISFSPANGEVRLVLRRVGAQARLGVEDGGPGVPPDRLKRIFERYYSERPGRGNGGDGAPSHFGIGLWIVRRNIEALSGRVWAENRSEGGLRMVVELPLRTGRPSPRPSDRGAPRPAASASGS